jgi:hypothetical protein
MMTLRSGRVPTARGQGRCQREVLGNAAASRIPADRAVPRLQAPRRVVPLTALLLLIATTAGGAELAQPDARITPGAVADTDPAIVCLPGYSRAHRHWHDKIGTLLRYGIPLAERNDYTDDDRVPICLGGDNASPLNHWPEPLLQAEQKDKLERRLCRALCAGRISLKAAQAIFLGDWRATRR